MNLNIDAHFLQRGFNEATHCWMGMYACMICAVHQETGRVEYYQGMFI